MSILYRVVAGLAVALLPPLAAAQTYPAKPVRMIVPGPGGGTPDLLARIVQPGLSSLLGQQIVVDNRAGAGGMIGTELAARALPDGYTLLWGGPGSLTIHQHLYKRVPFDSLKDFAPISLVSKSPMLLLCHPAVPVKTIRELIALAKNAPDKLNYASFGVGNLNHLAMEQFKSMAGVRMTHVPYTGSPPALAALLSGYVDLLFGSPPSTLDFVRSGRLRALGITSAKRVPLVPQIPTIGEAGVPGYETGVWSGLLAPAKTPEAIIARLNDAVLKAVHAPKIRSQLEAQGSEPVASSPQEFAAFVRAESEKNAKLVMLSGIKAD